MHANYHCYLAQVRTELAPSVELMGPHLVFASFVPTGPTGDYPPQTEADSHLADWDMLSSINDSSPCSRPSFVRVCVTRSLRCVSAHTLVRSVANS